MATGQSLINASLAILNILDLGGSPSPSESNDDLNELNAMWNAWSVDEGLIWGEISVTALMIADQAAYLIGPAAPDFPVDPTPQRIYTAYATTATNRTQLKIVNNQTYREHNDLTASSETPDEFYPDYDTITTSGFITGYLYPVPRVTDPLTLELNVAVPFPVWDLTTPVFLPYAMEDNIQKALAWRLIPRYGNAVAPGIAEVVESIGQKAEQRLIAMNSFNRQKAAPAPMMAAAK